MTNRCICGQPGCPLCFPHKTGSVLYEVAPSRTEVAEWVVEGINYNRDGVVYVAIFSGPDAEARAKEYAEFKNSGGLEVMG